MSNPKVSIIMAAYNRANTLPRAIDSVLLQDMPDWELIIVDDGSTDDTRKVIEAYITRDSRIRGAFHARNLHVHAAKNTGFDLMRGEWFTTLDSDDEMVPLALSTMLRVLKDIDPTIDAITCNCLDTTTRKFSGQGLDHDQWLDFETLVTKCHGEHWGLTKRTLLGNQRFNSKMRGSAESVLWWKISLKAKRYYIHNALRIYHTDGSDRISHRGGSVNLVDRIGFYVEMASETEYLAMLRQYRPDDYVQVKRNIALALAMANRRNEAWKNYQDVKSQLPLVQSYAVILAIIGGSKVAETIVRVSLRVVRGVS